MNPNHIYRIYVDKDKKQVVVLGVNRTETYYPPFDTLEEAYEYAYKLKDLCLQAKVNVEVYNGLDEAKSDKRLHDVRNSRH